jgi:bile acid-coenzyme A ligase
MPRLSISRLLTQSAQRFPQSPAVTCGAESVTFAEFDRRTNRLARAYAELGVAAGSLVTIALKNSVEFMESTFAVWKLGAIPQPVSYRLPDRERQAIVELANASLVVGADPNAHRGRQVIAAHFVPSDGLSDSELPDMISPTWKAPTSGGSTGRPKLILAGDPGEFSDEISPAFGLAAEGGECMLTPGPLYHNAPFAFSCRALMSGHHLVLMERFDPAETLEMISTHRPAAMLLVPTMMSRMARLPEEVRTAHDVSSLRQVWHMAAPCPEWLKQTWCDWVGPENLYELYAGTEAQAVTNIRGDEWLLHRGSVGRVVAGEMKVLDPVTHEEMPVGQAGEVFMRNTRETPTYTYLGAEPFRIADGWESLGDMGWFDADGYLYLGDRKGDMILSGGANIYPAETESALLEHPSIVSCAVIGLPDEDLGKSVHAIVQCDSPVATEELRAFLADRLVRYKIPRTFEFVDFAVRDDAGKVRRSALQAERS